MEREPNLPIIEPKDENHTWGTSHDMEQDIADSHSNEEDDNSHRNEEDDNNDCTCETGSNKEENYYEDKNTAPDPPASVVDVVLDNSIPASVREEVPDNPPLPL